MDAVIKDGPEASLKQMETLGLTPYKYMSACLMIEKVFSFGMTRETARLIDQKIYDIIADVPQFENEKPERLLLFIDMINDTRPNSERGKESPARLVEEIKKYEESLQPSLYLLMACCARSNKALDEMLFKELYVLVDSLGEEKAVAYYEEVLPEIAGPNAIQVARKIKGKIAAIKKHSLAVRPNKNPGCSKPTGRARTNG